MFRRTGMVCAGALVWVAAGCTPGSLLAPFAGPDPETCVAAGAVGVVSAILQARLADAGIAVFVKREAVETRLVCETASKKTFAVCLRPAKDRPGDNTTVSLLWAGEPDGHVWQTVRAALQPPAPAGKPATAAGRPVE